MEDWSGGTSGCHLESRIITRGYDTTFVPGAGRFICTALGRRYSSSSSCKSLEC